MIVGVSHADSQFYIRGEGDGIVFIDFAFTVPSGNGGNFKLGKFERSYYPFTKPAHFIEMYFGELGQGGLYYYNNAEEICDTKVFFHGERSINSTIGIESQRNVRRNDLTILTKKKALKDSIMNLPSDEEYTYYIASSSDGGHTQIKEIVESMAHCKEVIIILTDSRGFLSKVFTGKKAVDVQKDTYINTGEWFALGIRRY